MSEPNVPDVPDADDVSGDDEQAADDGVSPAFDSLSANYGGPANQASSPTSYDENIREQDRFLPIANISRIMKKSLPNNAKIAKEAKETVQECVSEFISFITSEASDRCLQEKRKTINGEDLLWAMGNLGFDNYLDPLRVYLQRYREHMKGDKTSRKNRGSPTSNTTTTTTTTTTTSNKKKAT